MMFMTGIETLIEMVSVVNPSESRITREVGLRACLWMIILIILIDMERPITFADRTIPQKQDSGLY